MLRKLFPTSCITQIGNGLPWLSALALGKKPLMIKLILLKSRTRFGNRTLALFFTLSLALMFTCLSCSDDSSDPVSGKPSCQLTKITVNSSGRESETLTYTMKSVSSFVYDDAGNVIETSTDYTFTYSTGSKNTSQSVSNKQFDNQGFMVRDVIRHSSKDFEGKENLSTSDSEYKYENGRLAKKTVSNVDNGKANSYTQSYEYNEAGKLIKYSNGFNNSSITYQYNGDAIAKIIYTDGAGTTSSPFLQYDSKNRIVKSIETANGYSEENRYEYDADDEVTREERYPNGKAYSATTYEYDNRENTSLYVYSLTKGVPFVSFTRPQYNDKHNYTRYTRFKADASGTSWVADGSTVYTYDYNANNFPTASTSKTVNASGVETATGTTTYEYAGCK